MAGAHVIVTATGKLDAPTFLEPWVGEGALVLPVFSAGWEAATMEHADRLIADDRSQFKSFLGPLYANLREPDVELGVESKIRRSYVVSLKSLSLIFNMY